MPLKTPFMVGKALLGSNHRLRPNIKLPLDEHREHSHFARYGDAVCVETLLVTENPNCFCSDGAPDTGFFISFACCGLRRL
jgi:hypothetical protein